MISVQCAPNDHEVNKEWLIKLHKKKTLKEKKNIRLQNAQSYA